MSDTPKSLNDMTETEAVTFCSEQSDKNAGAIAAAWAQAAASYLVCVRLTELIDSIENSRPDA